VPPDELKRGVSLALARPDIAAEWHPTKNGALTPWQVGPGTHQKVWWRGNCGHDWVTEVRQRVQYNSSCPFCSGKKAIAGETDLETLRPEVSRLWHPTKNGELKPSMVTSSSGKLVWWLGGCGHTWSARISQQTRGGGCGVCRGYQIEIGVNDLASKRPDLAMEWHPIKNLELKPEDFTTGSSRKVWWLGKCGHEWDSAIASRTSLNTGCPVCANKKVLAGFNDLATLMPEIAVLWHPTKNGSLTPAMVTVSSGKRIFWLGVCGHSWESAVQNVSKGAGCSVCRGFQIEIGFNDLASQLPELAAQWHPIRNRDLTPQMVVAGSQKKVWWKCPKGDDHEWSSSIGNRVKGKGCPFCSRREVLVGFNDLRTTDPDIAAGWHPTKNGVLTAEMVTRGSGKRVWWKCPKGDDHEWATQVLSRTSLRTGCPICSGYKVVLSTSLTTTHPNIAAQWHPTKNLNLEPEQVSYGSSDRKVWWLGVCGHEWTDSINHRVRGRGCPVCRGFQIEIGFNDLASQLPELAAQWHPIRNRDLTPQMVTVSSNRVVWWLGVCGHEWQTSVNGRKFGETGCPSCAEFGYVPSKDGWLYLIEHQELEMLQIGITNRPEGRLRKHKNSGWTELDIRGPMPGDLARNLERDGLAALTRRGAQLGQRNATLNFSGHTEAWPTRTLRLDNLAQLISWIHEDD
jgi:hypothetical protein